VDDCVDDGGDKVLVDELFVYGGRRKMAAVENGKI
jgi:hypothetical protein